MEKKVIRSFDGTRIYYEINRRKSRIPLFFVHGMGGNQTAWHNLADTFNKSGYPTITMDLRGHGLSGKFQPKEEVNIEHFAEDINIILKKESIREVYLVGHCFGGFVSLVFSYLYPEKVKKLVLINPLYRDAIKTRRIINKFVKGSIGLLKKTSKKKISVRKQYPYIDYSRFKDQPYAYFFLHDIIGTPLQTYVHVLLASLTYKENFVDKIDVPTMIIAGNKDRITPSAYSKELAKRMNAKSKILSGDHLLFVRNPEQTRKEISRFINLKRGCK